VRIDREGLRAEGAIHDDVGGLASDTGQRDERVPVGRHFAAVLGDELLAECDDVLCLGIEQPDGLDVRFEPSSPSAIICVGVFTSWNSRRVALFTPTSVACAESTTATSSW
jgi:hypothetical protein